LPISDAERDNAALAIAKAVVNTGCRVLLGPVSPITDSLNDIIAHRLGSQLEQRRINRMIETSVDIVADRILKSLGNEYRGLETNEYIAATTAVVSTFEKSNIDAATVIGLDVDASRLREKVSLASRDVLQGALLSEPATELYQRILRDSCTYLVQFVTTMPSFEASALVQMLHRETQILRDLQRVLQRIPDSSDLDHFDTDYRQAVMNKLDRMELFGVRLNQLNSSYPLNVAYVGLQVIRSQEKTQNTSEGVPISVSSRVEDALAPLNRAVIVGEAGSGKTTLLRYIAVTCASKGFDADLSAWNDCTPFYIPLRRYVETELPTPSQFPLAVAANIIEEMPNRWINELLRTGKAIVLIDGVDEMPVGSVRDKVQAWLSDLVVNYPKARYIVTSRPTAVTEKWPSKSFAIVELQPMSHDDIRIFVHHWHLAIKDQVSDAEDLDVDERAVLAAIDTDRNLQQLAVNPLLCALLCALNKDRNRQLPKERMEIYAAALEMLLGRRDRERKIPGLIIDPAPQRIILRDLAFWMFRQGLATAPLDRVRACVERTIVKLTRTDATAAVALEFLISRSGLLREATVGQVDFIHRTFQEYLAAEAAIDSDEIELLINCAADDQWREVIIMATGHAQQRQRALLLRGLLESSSGDGGKKTTLLATACLQTAPELDPTLRQEIVEKAQNLVPPKTLAEAEALANVGSLVLEVLATHPPQNSAEGAASVRLAAKIGGEEGLAAISEIAATTPNIEREIVGALLSFDPEQYAARVFTRTIWGPGIDISGRHLLPYTQTMGSVEVMRLGVDAGMSLTKLGGRPPKLKNLTITLRPRANIQGLENWIGLTHIEITMVNTTASLAPLRYISTIECLRLVVNQGVAVNFDLVSLAEISALRHIQLDIDTNTTIDVSPLRKIADLRIFASSSVSLVGVNELHPSAQAANLAKFPPLY
jgi:hypothetical protein